MDERRNLHGQPRGEHRGFPYEKPLSVCKPICRPGRRNESGFDETVGFLVKTFLQGEAAHVETYIPSFFLFPPVSTTRSSFLLCQIVSFSALSSHSLLHLL